MPPITKRFHKYFSQISEVFNILTWKPDLVQGRCLIISSDFALRVEVYIKQNERFLKNVSAMDFR